ncbi:hypothetical protein [Novosphingopyxis iocasae]|uniref:hypothetical protein n=1 Tax=Novosphingopyxis iocasae TaxID=2762729 RepID=UPI001650EC78|nr:hypothetical protein [Novosphingopyxis iocasae]
MAPAEVERSFENPDLHAIEDIGRDEAGSVQLDEIIIGQIPPFSMLGCPPHEDTLALDHHCSSLI